MLTKTSTLITLSKCLHHFKTKCSWKIVQVVNRMLLMLITA